MNRFHDTVITANKMLIAGVFAGIALVIANSWGTALTDTVNKLMIDVRCGKDDGSDKYKACSTKKSLGASYIAAFVTTIFLAVVAIVIIAVTGKGRTANMTSTMSD